MDFDPTSTPPTPAVDDVTKAVNNSIMMLLGCSFMVMLLIAAVGIAIILMIRRNKSSNVMLQVLNVRDDQSVLQAGCPVGRAIVEAQPHWITIPLSQVPAFRWHQQNSAPASCVVYPNRKNMGMAQGQLTTPPQLQQQPPLQ